MAQANSNITSTRRGFLSQAAGLAAAGTALALTTVTPSPAADQLDTELVKAAHDMDVVDKAIEGVHDKFGDDADSRADYHALQRQRNDAIATLIIVPALSAVGVQAKAAVLRQPRLIEDYEQHQQVAVSLADDIAGRDSPALRSVAAMPVSTDAEIVAAGIQFEALLTKWMPAWFDWARLWREANEKTEAKFGEHHRDNAAWTKPLCGTSPATLFLYDEIKRNGCNAATEAIGAMFDEMVPLADLIREAAVTSVAGLRAKTLVSVLDFWPMMADHDGNFAFDVAENSHYSMFSAAVAVTGLDDFVGDIEKRLIADAGQTLRDGAPIAV